MMERKIVICSVCKQRTSLYRVERVDGVKKYVCSKHPKSEKKMKIEGVIEKDDKFGAYIWKTREHYCEECGKELKEFKKWWLHHMLPKAKNPYFRWDEKNIIILCYQHHNEAESAISYPKMKIFDFCERRKKELLELLESVGLNYESKIGI